MWNVLERAAEFGYRATTLEVINNFVIMIKMFQSELQKKNAYDLAILVGKNTGIIKELFNDKTTEGLARYENIQELLNSIKEFTETPTEDGELLDKSLGSYLQQITLLTDADDDKGESDVVKLMTIHAAKGLEFPVVFVGGLEETLFPNAMSINTREELEEERRLFYVAVTRAKQDYGLLMPIPDIVLEILLKMIPAGLLMSYRKNDLIEHLPGATCVTIKPVTGIRLTESKIILEHNKREPAQKPDENLLT